MVSPLPDLARALLMVAYACVQPPVPLLAVSLPLLATYQITHVDCQLQAEKRPETWLFHPCISLVCCVLLMLFFFSDPASAISQLAVGASSPDRRATGIPPPWRESYKKSFAVPAVWHHWHKSAVSKMKRSRARVSVLPCPLLPKSIAGPPFCSAAASNRVCSWAEPRLSRTTATTCNCTVTRGREDLSFYQRH